MKLSYKKVSRNKPELNTERTKDKRFEFVLDMITVISNNKILIFVDETGINFDI